MNRRSFLEILSGSLVCTQLVGCNNESNETKLKHMDTTIPDSSKVNLHNNLDRLLRAFESKGMNMNESLLPGISDPELKDQCSWSPGALTKEIIALMNGEEARKKMLRSLNILSGSEIILSAASNGRNLNIKA